MEVYASYMRAVCQGRKKLADVWKRRNTRFFCWERFRRTGRIQLLLVGLGQKVRVGLALIRHRVVPQRETESRDIAWNRLHS